MRGGRGEGGESRYVRARMWERENKAEHTVEVADAIYDRREKI